MNTIPLDQGIQVCGYGFLSPNYRTKKKVCYEPTGSTRPVATGSWVVFVADELG